MDVIYYRSPSGNFGDDLNAILWRELLPASCFAADDAVLLGIGSIFRDDFLSEDATRDKRVFVLGSGAGTGPLPKLWPNAAWSILAVRGPLTASLIGMPSAAATDAAALLATATRLLPERAERGYVAFFPHHNSVPFSRWEEACRLAGMVFVDAHRPPGEVLNMLGGARLVVAEAMHGAIVADTLRIPWVPVVCSPSIVPFKWLDWTRSLDLDYRPVVLPASSGWEVLRHLKIRIVEPREVHRNLWGAEHDGEVIEDFHRRYGGVATDDLVAGPLLNGRLKSVVQKATSVLDALVIPRAAEALSRAARSRAWLSDDRVFANRLDRLQEGVAALRRASAS